MSLMRLAGCLVVVSSLPGVSACGPGPLVEERASAVVEQPRTSPEIGGALICQIQLSPNADFEHLAANLERDRMYQAARPGFLLQRVGVGPGTASIQMLFDTYGHARDFSEWLEQRFDLYGIPFWSRPDFVGHECMVAELVGRAELVDRDEAHVMTRTELFDVEGPNARGKLQGRFAGIVAEAGARSYTSVWMLYSGTEHQAALVSFDDSPAIFGDPPLIDRPAVDRSGLTLSIWYPFVLGDQGLPSLWLNSPGLLPAPGPGDGVCEPSRGETSVSTDDCPLACGDGVEDPGETFLNCPSDVRLFP